MNLTQLILQSHLPIRELSTKEAAQLKATFVDMYKDIVAVCEKYGLLVMMSGGSCLGAIRHNGFIPWDDDLDLIMMRSDYVKLPSLLEKEYGNTYRCVGANISKDASIPFMKIERTDTIFTTIYDLPNEQHGIGIDIFPIDNIPDNRLLRLWHGFRLNLWQYLALCGTLYEGRKCYATQLLRSTKDGRKKINWRLAIGSVVCTFVHPSCLYEHADRIAAAYQDRDTIDVTIPTGRAHYFGEIHPRKVFFPISEGFFEGVKAYLPHDYDTYLRGLYGDTYMQIPPKDKQEKHFIVDLQIP